MKGGDTMQKRKFKLTLAVCKRCNAIWIPRTPKPKRCPACGKASWDKKRKDKANDKK